MAARPAIRIASRVLAATIGAYVVTAGSAALIAVLLVLAASVARSDALIVGSVVGYLVFAALMLWCFAERRLMLVWLILMIAAVATHGLAMLIEPILPATRATP